jgi:IMP dehydrogenase
MDDLNGKLIKEGYTFDDLLLVPAHSTVVPANVDLATTLTPRLRLKLPILSAAMDTVTEAAMATALAKAGGLGILHKNMPIEAQAAMVRSVKSATVDHPSMAAVDDQGRLLVGAAVGVSAETMTRVKALVAAEVDVIAVDSAHGHSQGVISTIAAIRAAYPHLELIGGNIVTAQAARDLIEAGASILKVGVGPGSICTTRIVAGVGVPQITAVNDVYQIAKAANVSVIADGGIKFSGDIVKALAAGADAVMLGGLLAGCEETPGEVIDVYGKKVKTYMGMGSLTAMQKGSSDRYFQGGQKELSKLVPEGIEATVPFKGPIADILYQMMGGLRSGMGYCGCANLSDLKTKARFVKITNAGLNESHPHDVDNVKEAPNYRGR